MTQLKGRLTRASQNLPATSHSEESQPNPPGAAAENFQPDGDAAFQAVFESSAEALLVVNSEGIVRRCRSESI